MHKRRRTRKLRRSQIGMTVQAWREGKAFVAYSPELDVSSCGDSLPQAKERLREAIGLFLEEAARRGTLEDILSEAGFVKRHDTYHPRRLLERVKVRLAVPAPGP